jgi:RNA polymerase sigma-70 factor (ECF subfamily)
MPSPKSCTGIGTGCGRWPCVRSATLRRPQTRCRRRSCPPIGPRGGFAAVTTWLHRIVVNACLDRLRRRSIRPVVPMGDDATLDSVAPKNADPTSAHELSLDVNQALQRIPFEQRAALVLVDMMGYAVDDAAKVLDVPPGTIKSRCARGRARLAPLLGHLRNQGGGSTVESAEEGGGKPA